MRLPTLQTLLSSALLFILLAATLTHALPGGGETSTPKDKPKLVPNELATWNCTHKYKVIYSHYKLSGCDWNKTAKEIKRAVENEGIITRWKYSEENKTDGRMCFNSSVSLFFLLNSLLFLSVNPIVFPLRERLTTVFSDSFLPSVVQLPPRPCGGFGQEYQRFAGDQQGAEERDVGKEAGGR